MEKELIEHIAKALVSKPDEVVVTVIEGEKLTILELNVSEDDVGKVIGKQGRIAKALRVLIGAVAGPSGKRVILEILD